MNSTSKSLRTVLMATAGFILLITLPSPATAQTGSIVGLIELANGYPAHTIIRIPGTFHRARTDELGQFEMHDVPAGQHQLHILGSDTLLDVTVIPGDTVKLYYQVPPQRDLRENPAHPPRQRNPTPVGIWLGLGATATPTEIVLTPGLGIRYGFVGVQGAFYNVSDTDRSGFGGDLILYLATRHPAAFFVSGGAYFAEETLYGFGVGFTVPFDMDEMTGPAIGFGFHTLKGVEISLALTDLW